MSALTPIRDHCLAPSRAAEASFEPGARYGRLFPELPPLSVDEDALLALGMVGGICDAGVACTDGEGA